MDGCCSGVECLPGMCKGLDSIPSTAEKKLFGEIYLFKTTLNDSNLSCESAKPYLFSK